MIARRRCLYLLPNYLFPLADIPREKTALRRFDSPYSGPKNRASAALRNFPVPFRGGRGTARDLPHHRGITNGATDGQRRCRSFGMF